MGRLKPLWVNYLYLWHALAFLLLMLGIGGGWTIFCLISLCVGLSVIGKLNGYKIVDTLVIIFVLYSILSYFIFMDYPYSIYTQSLRDQIIPVSFYFISRSKQLSENRLINNMVYVVFVVCLIGFYLFFLPPVWYLDYIFSNFSMELNYKTYYEFTRMSSIYPHSYFVGYSSLFVFMFLLIQRVKNHIRYKYDNWIIFVSLVSLFLAQQRVSIAFAILFIFILVIRLVINKEIKPVYLFLGILFITISVLLIYYIFVTYMDDTYIEYILNRSTDEDIVDKRISMFDEYIKTISFFGQGLGKFSHNAMKYDMPSIGDCEYIRLPNELGLFGLSIFFVIILLTYLSLIIKRKMFCFEILCISFFLVAMIGATPLESSTQQSFFLWFCLGRVHNGSVI